MAVGEEDVEEEVEELGVATARRGLIYVGGDMLSSILTFVLLIYLARTFQPAVFGIYSIVIAFATLLNVGSNFGVGTAFRKMLPEVMKDRSRINSILSNGYFIALLLGAIIGAIGFLASGYLAVSIFHNSSLTILLQVAAVAELLAVIYNLTLAALTGLGRVKLATISNVTYGAVGLIATVAFVYYGYGVLGAMFGLIAAYVLAAIAGFIGLLRETGFRLVKIKKRELKELGGFSAPVVASHLAQFGVQNFAVLFLGAIAVTSVVGNYGSAYKLARIIELAITDLTFILLPAYAITLSKDSTSHKIGNIYNNSIYYTSLILLPIIAYVIATAVPLANLFLGGSYTTAPFYFAVMAAGMTLSIIGIYAGTLIIGKGDTRKFMKYQIIAMAVQLALVLGLTPYLQADGTLIALFVITPVVLDIIYVLALKEQFKFKQEFGGVSRVAIAAVITLALLYGVALGIGPASKWLILINAVLALLIFPPLAALLKAVSKKNLEFISRMGDRLRPAKPIINALVNYTAIFIK